MDRKAKYCVGTESTVWPLGWRLIVKTKEAQKFHIKIYCQALFEARVYDLAIPRPERKLKNNK